MKKFFYATTTQIPTDGWGFTNDDPVDDVFFLKPTFTEKHELVVHSETNPWQSLHGLTLPPGTVMIACWIETTPGIIDLYGDMSYFVGDMEMGITPKDRPRGNCIALPDGRALQVLDDQLEFVKTIAPSAFGLQSWAGTPIYEQRVYELE